MLFTVIIPADYEIPTLESLANKTVISNAVCEGKSIGEGLFLAESAEAGEIVAQYPGNPTWEILDSEGNLPFANKYVFELGTFTVMGDSGKRTVKRSLVWNPILEIRKYDFHKRAYAINTSHPRSLESKYRYTNTIYGIQIINLTLDCKVRPNVNLFIVTLKKLEPRTQLLLDYHWHLSWDGFWCLDNNCRLCVEGLKDFVAKMH